MDLTILLLLNQFFIITKMKLETDQLQSIYIKILLYLTVVAIPVCNISILKYMAFIGAIFVKKCNM